MVSWAFKKSSTFTSTQRTNERSSWKFEFLCNAEFTVTDRMDNLRQNLLAVEIPDFITNNRRTSSIKYYESVWKKWCGWYSEREVSPTRSDINEILDFLVELFENGWRYGTIRIHRSVISTFSWSNCVYSSDQLPKRICSHVRYIQKEASPKNIFLFGM